MIWLPLLLQPTSDRLSVIRIMLKGILGFNKTIDRQLAVRLTKKLSNGWEKISSTSSLLSWGTIFSPLVIITTTGVLTPSTSK